MYFRVNIKLGKKARKTGENKNKNVWAHLAPNIIDPLPFGVDGVRVFGWTIIKPNYFKKQHSSFLLTKSNDTVLNLPGVFSRLVPDI